MRKLLYVDDEEINLELFKMNFENDFEVEIAESGKEGIQMALNKNIKVVVSDLKMPDMNGIEMIEQIKLQAPGTVCILLSAYFETEAKKMGLNKEQIFSYVTKPWRREPMLKIIENAFEFADRLQNT
jgi:response regulator RpfG family c-di-GMP phosphodiesterase